ncbi:MAG: tetratricopeptide repeat protein [Pseudomonadales bacterium]
MNYCRDCSSRDEAHFQLGRFYQQQGQHSKAVSAFAHVSTQSAQYWHARYYVTDAQLRQLEQGKWNQQRYRQALESLKQQALPTNKKKTLASHWQLLQARAALLGEPPNPHRALQILNASQQQFAKETALAPQALRLKTTAYYQLGKNDLAKASLNSLSNKAANNKVYYQQLQQLADYFYQSKNTTAALSAYQQLARLSQQTSYQRYREAIDLRIAKLYLQSDQPQLAEQQYAVILQYNPRSADTLYALAQLHEQQHQWSNAITVWRKLADGLKEGSQHWFTARYHTAAMHQQLNNSNKACSIAKMTLVLHPNFGDDALKKQFETLKATTCTTMSQ